VTVIPKFYYEIFDMIEMSAVKKGKFCRVDYSGYPEEKDYANHVATLADDEIPKVKSIHTGLDPDKEITFKFERVTGNVAGTGGKEITLNLKYLDDIKNAYGDRNKDNGCIIHKISHAILMAPNPLTNKFWMFEALADYVRHMRGYRREDAVGAVKMEGAYPHYEKGNALNPNRSQVCAHFLLYLEKSQPRIVKELVNELVSNSYDETIFQRLFNGKTLPELVKMYEDKEDKILEEKRIAEEQRIRDEKIKNNLWSRLFAAISGFFGRIRKNK